MVTVIMSIVSFICVFGFFYYEMNKLKVNKKIKIILSFLLSIPTLNVTSILFIFEAHFVILTLVFEMFIKLIGINYQSKSKVFYMIIPLPLILSFGLIYYGLYNMNNIVKTEYRIDTNKEISEDYRIAMIAYLHYPTSVNKIELEQLVERISDEKADYVMLCGDIIDEYTSKEEKEEVFEALGKLSNTTNVFYVYGNHDLRKYSFNNKSSVDDLTSLIELNGIHVLNDEQIILNDEITLIGRSDYSLHDRKEMNSYDLNDNTYNIVVDHQPRELENCSNNNIDLHLSGHTHAGQIFPLYYIYEFLNINELNYGLETVNQMNAINSSGVSGWGFPIRTEQHSEYVVVDIH